LVLAAEIKTAATAISGRKSGSFERRRKVVPSVGNRTNDHRRVSSDKSIGGNVLVTTEPAATTEFSPTVTPPMIVAPAAIHTFLSITMDFAVVKARRRDGSTGWPDVMMRSQSAHPRRVFVDYVYMGGHGPIRSGFPTGQIGGIMGHALDDPEPIAA
jgi:hypothetical protein